MRILSLFDGMACGMIAMKLAGVEVESYDAYEIDKYAVKTAQHNFPMINEHGDVFAADFTRYDGIDLLIGGSPCTYWSTAQMKNRETVASGMGWELFTQYVRALHESKPKYFIYENNKSMSKEIRASIDEAFGFEAVCINSALVSAQSRQRLYWVGKRNDDGTYSKVNVEQPEDRGILLKDVLDSAVAWQDKSYIYTTRYQGATIENNPVCVKKQVFGRKISIDGTYDRRYEARADGKSNTLTTSESDIRVAVPVYDICQEEQHGELSGSQAFRIYDINANGKDGKEITIYEVKDGKITIKDKKYPIKLKDGYYIIRKLTISECKRLQTVPEWYEFLVNNSQAYKMLGNGWTCEVIKHLVESCLNEETAAKAAHDEVDKQVAEAKKRAEDAEKAAKEAAEALEQAKRQAASSDPDTAVFKTYFSAVQEDFNRLHGVFLKIQQSDPGKADKLKTAMTALLQKMGDTWK